ncbi:GCN5 family acetyltransferase [Humibacillus sp. DSM 29435]|nr:GCN5 family acetyltransferase [Humibacillus sp. DSM 29435]
MPSDRAHQGEAVSLWSDDSRVVGFGWAEAPDWLELQVDPGYPEVADEVIEWFEEWSDAETQSALVMEGDVAEPALAAAGFAPEVDQPFFCHHLLDLTLLNISPSRSGYTFRHVELSEAAARSACHRAAWSQFGPSPVSAGAYAALMAAWPYRADLDWVAVDGDGAMVASCLVWFDPGTGVGLVEPVGCVPDHRGRGLAAAVTVAALTHLRELGAGWAQVTSRGDEAYPAPQRLFRSLGFRPTARTVTWTRSLT